VAELKRKYGISDRPSATKERIANTRPTQLSLLS
jgi:hypothetical protein